MIESNLAQALELSKALKVINDALIEDSKCFINSISLCGGFGNSHIKADPELKILYSILQKALFDIADGITKELEIMGVIINT